MSLVINKPNRVYISSGDSTGYSPNNSRFDISFENPIYFPKSVSLVSAEYANSFYNIKILINLCFTKCIRMVMELLRV